MSLDAIVRRGVALVDKVTTPLQPFVTRYSYIGQDAYGKPTYAAPISTPAIVEYTSKLLQTADGKLVQSIAHITFPRPLPPNGSPNRLSEPIDSRDKIILPNGSTGPIVMVSGFIDKTINLPFISEVWLGR